MVLRDLSGAPYASNPSTETAFATLLLLWLLSVCRNLVWKCAVDHFFFVRFINCAFQSYLLGRVLPDTLSSRSRK